ncbi:hypothetical protein SHELI_v1c10910 [Spiroplasma helicoides]|uniref:Uncharacterized protein n=1 Tax=Spiroplasma helicoides TaxID=216938 RepID=A0A1B3SM78_9MOLU|nr:hypothetical protein [Spiroplasma helicoides]AOG61038.1 hypothetical protein SHELI_v1c10910 [Spiroplasma helicoides]
MVWGESNSRAFLDWADYCRSNAIRSRGIANTGGPNFTNDRSSANYQNAKQQLLDYIQRNTTISVQELYNILPTPLVANPTIKHVLLQLYYEDNLQIEGRSASNSDRETDFVLTFVKKASPQKPVQQVFQGEKKQSNIEDVFDNNWRATGRKLEFDKREKPKREDLNISLKKTPKPTFTQTNVKPVVDVRQQIQVPKVKIEPIVVDVPKFVAPKVKVENVNYIQIPKPEPEPIIEQPIIEPTIKLNLEIRKPSEVEIPEIEEKVFYGLSDYELYYIEAFLGDAIHKENNLKKQIMITKELVRTKADIAYLNSKDEPSIVLKVIAGVLCLVLVGFIILAAISKNKVRSKAYKAYNQNFKTQGYEQIKKQIRLDHPKIITF